MLPWSQHSRGNLSGRTSYRAHTGWSGCNYQNGPPGCAGWQRIEQVFTRLLHDLRHPARLHADLAANALEEILLCAALHNSRTHAQALDPRVASVLKELNTHYREAVTIQQLAQQVALSPSRLAHLFKQEVGRSIIETLLAIRLQQAARLLGYTSLHIGEIAREVGFQSASYLSRQFSAYYGQSPQAYRQQRKLGTGG
jgi:AraC family transcriptional regulator, arabinose operon regulatory protein